MLKPWNFPAGMWAEWQIRFCEEDNHVRRSHSLANSVVHDATQSCEEPGTDMGFDEARPHRPPLLSRQSHSCRKWLALAALKHH